MPEDAESPERFRQVLEMYAAFGLRLKMTDTAWFADLYEKVWNERDALLAAIENPASPSA